MSSTSGLGDFQDIGTDHPWVREVWLLGPAASHSPSPEVADLLVICEGSPRSVPPGQRHRLLGEVETLTNRRLELRLSTAEQLSKWLSTEPRFAAAFRGAERLFPQEEEN
jgi:hypothetical protein